MLDGHLSTFTIWLDGIGLTDAVIGATPTLAMFCSTKVIVFHRVMIRWFLHHEIRQAAEFTLCSSVYAH